MNDISGILFTDYISDYSEGFILMLTQLVNEIVDAQIFSFTPHLFYHQLFCHPVLNMICHRTLNILINLSIYQWEG